MIYIRYIYETFPGLDPQPPTFIGPFPETTIACEHRLIYGPIGENSRIVRLDEAPDPQHTMTPGEAVDYTLARY